MQQILSKQKFARNQMQRCPSYTFHSLLSSSPPSSYYYSIITMNHDNYNLIAFLKDHYRVLQQQEPSSKLN